MTVQWSPSRETVEETLIGVELATEHNDLRRDPDFDSEHQSKRAVGERLRASKDFRPSGPTLPGQLMGIALIGLLVFIPFVIYLAVHD